MKVQKNYHLFILIIFSAGLFSVNLTAQIVSTHHQQNGKLNVFPSDQPFASYWFPIDLLSWSPSADPDAPYNRSGVPLKNRYIDSVTNVNSNARSNEGKVNPLAAFAPTSNNPSQGSLDINYYSFSFWQYIDQMVFWGGSAGEGLILAPNPTIIDAAHRNGVKIFGNVFFPPTAYGGQIQWVNDFLQKNGNTFPVADKLIQVAEYYGFDGWFINQETAGGNSQTASDMRDFMIYIQNHSNIQIEWYDAMIENGNIAWQNQLDSQNDSFFQYGDTLVSQKMFLNFSWSASGLKSSRTYAQNLNRSEYDLYAGIDVEANGYNSYVNWQGLFPDTQPHVTSLGIYRPDWCYNSSSSISDYYDKSSIFWVGWNHDPSNTTTSNSWKGIANYIPAFTPITGAPFVTNFCTGQGHDFYIDGVKLSYPALSSNGWNNLSLQDVLPTWQWIVHSSGVKLTPEFDFTDAYYGGNCLKISGDLSSDNLIELYKADCTISSNTKFEIAFKTGNVGATNMQVALAYKGTPSTYVYFDVGNTTTAGWNLKTIDLGPYSGQTISAIALYFTSGYGSGYQIKIGRLGIYNGTIQTPNTPANLYVEKKVDDAGGFVTLRLRWDHSTSDHYYYNVFRRNHDSSLTYLGGTANNAYFVPYVAYQQGDSAVPILVQTVGNDFGESAFAETNFEWYSPPGMAANPSPTDGDSSVVRNVILSWTPGNGASSSDVYLGTTNPPPFITNVTTNYFQTSLLNKNTTYYWRIDSKNQYYTTQGDAWSYTTGASISDTNDYALQFDGTDDLLDCGNSNSLQITGNQITLEAWINVNQFKSQQYAGSVIVKDEGGIDSGYMIRCGGNGVINFNIGNGNWHEINTPENSVQLNNWYHVAATYDGTAMKIYIDGELKAEENLPGLNIGNAVDKDLFIGESAGFPGRVFNGKINEIRVWNIARTQQEIQSTMNTGLSPEYYLTPDSGLVGYWKLDEGSGQTAADLSYYANNATLGTSANPDSSDPAWVEANILILNVNGENKNSQVPMHYNLSQNYPNPFNPSTEIRFQIANSGLVTLKIYDVLGREVKTLVNEYKPAGIYNIKFDASNFPSGVYFYKLTSKNFSTVKKMILLK